MRIILAVGVTFASAFIIVGVTASVIETWALNRRQADVYSPAEQRPIPQAVASASFIPTSMNR